MDMDFPTSRFEDGRWVTRHENAFSIFARNNKAKAEPVKKSAETPKVPDYGILMQEVSRSPVVKLIIPARIRHANRNDVLYITPNAVEIKEAREDYTLSHVAFKDDFDSPIRAARICGRQRQPAKPDIRAIIPTGTLQDSWENPAKVDEAELMDVDSEASVKLELEDDTSMTLDQEDQWDDETLRSSQLLPLRRRSLPPHILVLSLESGRLVFLYSVNGDNDHPLLVTTCLPLFKPDGYDLHQLGEFLAVDPK